MAFYSLTFFGARKALFPPPPKAAGEYNFFFYSKIYLGIITGFLYKLSLYHNIFKKNTI